MDWLPRKLIEVALPLEAVNAAGQAEKAVPKKGHPATMHLWWSRKPLGVARAVLFASLVDDPSARPDLYPTEVAQEAERQRLLALIEGLCRWERSGDTALLAEAQRCIATSAGDDLPRIIDPFCGGGAIGAEALRLGLDTLAIDLNPVAALVSAATLSVAQRFAGRPAVGSGNFGGGDGLTGIVTDIALYGASVEAECRRRLAGMFEAPASPSSPGGRTGAISYLWARTITCANPRCRRTTPLLSTWWLSKKPTNLWHARPVFERDRFDFEVASGPPPSGLVDLKVGRGANFRCLFCGDLNDADRVRRCGQESGFGLRLVAVQALADPQRRRGGRIWLAPDAAVEQVGLAPPAPPPSPGSTTVPGAGVSGRSDLRFVPAVEAALRRELPMESGNITTFGVTTFGDLLTPRQRLTMATFSEVVAAMAPTVHRDALAAGMADDGAGVERGGSGARAYAEAITTYLALTLSRMANRTTTMTVHNRANGSVEQSFVQPAYVFYGDFPEANPFSGSTGSWSGGLGYVVRAVEALPAPLAFWMPEARSAGLPDEALGGSPSGGPPLPRVGRGDVRCASMLTALDGAIGVICTDPPYYDMFDYASLSNLFLVWLRATIGDIWPGTLGPLLAPTDEQIVANAARIDGDRAASHAHFETLLSRALERIRDAHDPRYPITIYYGYQQAERSKRADPEAAGTAWEALLESLIGAGLRITATWPLRTERPEGVKKGTKSLASSVLLVCRPAPVVAEDGSIAERAGPVSVPAATTPAGVASGGTRTEVESATGFAPSSTATVGDLRRALRAELPGAVGLLQQGNIAPLDLAQAAIGPGMGVYTRYERVLMADGSLLGVREALALINEVLDEILGVGGADLDADTRWALTWFDEYGFAEGPFGEAEQLSKARNTSVAGLVAAGIVTTAGDRVRLLGRHEPATDWDPADDSRLATWEATQYLLRTLYDDGEPAAAALLSRLDADTADASRDLAYRLFQLCTRRNRAAEAAACNSLVTSWPELTRLASAVDASPTLL